MRRSPRAAPTSSAPLLAAMETMRDNIRADGQSRKCRSAVPRRRGFSDALETSREGVVLLDAGRPRSRSPIRAPSEFIRLSPQLLQLGPARCRRPGAGRARRAIAMGFASEARLADGRWLRVSRSETQEGGVVLVYSDISTLEGSRRRSCTRPICGSMRRSPHMSQGLCLYNSEARLQVANRRFCEIFDISPELVVPGMTHGGRARRSASPPAIMADRTVADLLAERESSLAQHEGGNYLQHLNDGRIIAIAQRPTSDGGWLVTCEDVTEQQRAESQIAFMARHDALTKLPNRTLARRADRAGGRAGRPRTRLCGVLPRPRQFQAGQRHARASGRR